MSDGDISFTFSWVIWISPFFNFCLGTMLMALIFLVTLVVISLAENPLKKWPKICVFFQVQFPASSKKYSTTDRSTKTIKGALGHRDRAFLGDSSSFQWHNENQNLCAKEFRFSCFFLVSHLELFSQRRARSLCAPHPPPPIIWTLESVLTDPDRNVTGHLLLLDAQFPNPWISTTRSVRFPP